MSAEKTTRARSAQVIVVGNEKGGSGKSTVAMHIAVSLLNSGRRVATIDLDSRQRSFTHYIENRSAWAKIVNRNFEVPNHTCFNETVIYPTAEDEAAACNLLTETVDALANSHSFIVMDTAGYDSSLIRLAHSMADTLVTPLNDSFVDLAVLGTIDPQTFGITGTSHYSEMVAEARRQRQLLNYADTDWIVLRNRLSMLGSRNKRFVDYGLEELSHRLNFRCIEGLAERVIYREFYPRGLTALDDLDDITLGTRPTLSHATARIEIENLISSIILEDWVDGELVDSKRDAA